MLGIKSLGNNTVILRLTGLDLCATLSLTWGCQIHILRISSTGCKEVSFSLLYKLPQPLQKKIIKKNKNNEQDLLQFFCNLNSPSCLLGKNKIHGP